MKGSTIIILIIIIVVLILIFRGGDDEVKPTTSVSPDASAEVTPAETKEDSMDDKGGAKMEVEVEL